ncbi:MAG: amidohydrolase family protein [bacterium]|nr:amidohydrolase family protein [bacterium]
MPTILAVDAHHHLWDLGVSHYRWLHPNPDGDPFPDFEKICRDYTIADYRADLAGCDVVKSVHVQAEHDADDPVRETEWLQRVADDPDSGGFPHAIVAGIDLSRPDFEGVLEAQAGHANVRGVRQILDAHATAASGDSAEDALASRAAQLRDETWLQHFGLLRRFGLSFDLQLFAWQQDDARALLERHDDVQIVLNHTLMPFDRSNEGMALWRRGLAFFARHPNVALKISGLGMAPGGWDPAANHRLILEAIEAFGTDRCFFGSNFPIDGLVANYRSIWSTFRDAIDPLSEDEQVAMLRGNAERVYRI